MKMKMKKRVPRKMKSKIKINNLNPVKDIKKREFQGLWIEKTEGQWYLTTTRLISSSETYWAGSGRGGGGHWASSPILAEEKVILDEPELCFIIKLHLMLNKFKNLLHRYRWEILTRYTTPHIMYEVENILKGRDKTMEEIYDNLPYKSLSNLNQALRRLQKERVVFRKGKKYSLSPFEQEEKEEENTKKRISLQHYSS